MRKIASGLYNRVVCALNTPLWQRMAAFLVFVALLRWHSQILRWSLGTAGIRVLSAWQIAWHWWQNNFIGPVNWIDVLVGTCILAIIPFVLAAYGGHLAAEPIDDPRMKRRTKAKFWGLCFVGVILAFYQQYRASQSDNQRDKREDGAQQTILAELRNLHQSQPVSTPQNPPRITVPKPTEEERRKSILNLLRNRYILSNQSTDPDILSGKKDPPRTWLNDQLKALGEVWLLPIPPVKIKSWELQPFEVGKKVSAKIHYSADVDDERKVAAVYFMIDADDLTDNYSARLALENQLWMHVPEPDPALKLAVLPNTDNLFTVTSDGMLSQELMDKLWKTRVFYFMAKLRSEDGTVVEGCILAGAHDVKFPGFGYCINHN